ncbi:MAG TPA: hypothetical protein VM099_09310, partial [Gemmatimonadaceae bacterium]|nr:hypothetical protein [Gemmatimonadaceae bacterium]
NQTASHSGNCNDPKEIPETANHPAGIELLGKESPRKRRGADESDKKSEIGGQVLDRRTTEMIKLRLQKSSGRWRYS